MVSCMMFVTISLSLTLSCDGLHAKFGGPLLKSIAEHKAQINTNTNQSLQDGLHAEFDGPLLKPSAKLKAQINTNTNQSLQLLCTQTFGCANVPNNFLDTCCMYCAGAASVNWWFASCMTKVGGGGKPTTAASTRAFLSLGVQSWCYYDKDGSNTACSGNGAKRVIEPDCECLVGFQDVRFSIPGTAAEQKAGLDACLLSHDPCNDCPSVAPWTTLASMRSLSWDTICASMKRQLDDGKVVVGYTRYWQWANANSRSDPTAVAAMVIYSNNPDYVNDKLAESGIHGSDPPTSSNECFAIRAR